MRNRRMRRKSLILTMLALTLTLTPAMFAQQQSVVSAAAESIQDERQAGPALPCKNYDEYDGGKPDNFNVSGPPELAPKSPGLLAYFSSNHLTPRNFDEPGSDKALGQSFFIRCCKVCRAELEIRIREESSGPNAGDNDAITVGQAPSFSPRAASGKLWTSPFVPGGNVVGNPKTITIPLSVGVLNVYISKADTCNVPIDIYVQDDTAVDYVKLKIWTY
jgi:hypothetical protein